MDDSAFAAHKLKQQRWMREREVDLARENIEADSMGELVHKLADQISSNRRTQPQEELHKTVADEIDANTCSICLELMLPPENSPVILFPCGHTFCKTCVNLSEKKYSLKLCPCCKAKVASTAINYSLQSVIVAYAASKTRPPKQQLQPTQPVGNLALRLNILHEERSDKERQLIALQDNIEVAEAVIEVMRAEEVAVLERLRTVQQELGLVRSKIEEQEDRVADLKRMKAKTSQSLMLIDATIEPLELEVEKGHWIK